MNLSLFIEKITNGIPVSFDETMAIIAENYRYQPTGFYNGLGADNLFNPAGSNEGSCKIFAFALLHGLDQQQTLALFGDYYRVDVLSDPGGAGHRNIRNFMRYGWLGVRYDGEALVVNHIK